MKKDIIVITGGASGIGKCLAQIWSKAGKNVWALDIQEQSLNEMQVSARVDGLSLKAVPCDITHDQSILKIIEDIEKDNSRIEMWVNCAGTGGIGAFEKQTPDEYNKIIELNLLSIVRITRMVLAHQQKNGFGQIVNVSSVAGFVPAPYMSAYNLTKHALVGFTRSMQLEMELTSSPIQFTLVAPGFVRTEMVRLGKHLGFPDWLSPMLTDAEPAAREIVEGISKGKTEIFPTINGKVMLGLYKRFPQFISRRSKILLTKSWKDVIFNRVNL